MVGCRYAYQVSPQPAFPQGSGTETHTIQYVIFEDPTSKKDFGLSGMSINHHKDGLLRPCRFAGLQIVTVVACSVLPRKRGGGLGFRARIREGRVELYACARKKLTAAKTSERTPRKLQELGASVHVLSLLQVSSSSFHQPACGSWYIKAFSAGPFLALGLLFGI